MIFSLATAFAASPPQSPLGLGWTAESDQQLAYFGLSVAGAGDINGDGYGDVVVGADGYSAGQRGEGRVSAYFGSASGLEPLPAWTAEGDQVAAAFGIAVASAGDVNAEPFRA
jgi:hypothetical protein